MACRKERDLIYTNLRLAALHQIFLWKKGETEPELLGSL